VFWRLLCFIIAEKMEDNTKLIESLLERALDYGKTSYELVKLKALDKTTDVVSTAVPHIVVFILILLFLLFFNLGLAFWLGEILGKIYFGFFAIAAFYAIAALVLHFVMHKRLKVIIGNIFVKQVLN
jgi:hypothetical protein